MLQNLIKNNLYRKSLLSYVLWPLSLLFTVVGFTRRIAYEIGILKAYDAPLKIFSIGNIVSGGSGKTPSTIWLANYLISQGKKVAVSHRGYKGEFENNTTIISSYDKIFDNAPQAGDETFLLASKLPGIPVIAGKNRTEAIKILIKKFPDLEAIILDDSFQHLKVKHDADIIIFNEIGGIGNGFVLPAGILREPLSALKHADIIIYNGKSKCPKSLNKYCDKIISTHYDVIDVITETGMSIKPENIEGNLALISAIGMPESFERTVTQIGLEFSKHFIFKDHNNFSQKEITKLLNHNYDYYLTTEKDYAKLRFLNTKGKLLIIKVGLNIPEQAISKFSSLLY